MKQEFTHDRHQHVDAEMRELLSQNLPEAPADQWFSRKVMNRLPDKPGRRRISIAERLCYIAGIMLIFGVWGYYIIHTIYNGLTYQALIAAGFMPLITLFCLGIYAVPAIRRML